MNIGYARTSTLDQTAGFEAQIEALRAVGCDKLFQEQVSSVSERPELDEALEFARKGDTIVVTKLDRLARHVRHLGEIVDRLAAKGVALRILDLGLDTGTASGKLMLNVMGAVAQFEREMMLERQREGIAKARTEGKYKGRQPIADDKRAEIRRLVAMGIPKARVAREVGVGTRTVFRVVEEAV